AMTGLMLVPVVLSLVVLGAHFLRSGSYLVVGVVLLLIALLGVRRRFTPPVVRIALLLGTLEWVRTLWRLASDRMQEGRPYLRLVAILGGVALLTGLSALLFRTARLRGWYASGS